MTGPVGNYEVKRSERHLLTSIENNQLEGPIGFKFLQVFFKNILKFFS